MSCDILKVQKVQKPEKWAKPFNTAIAAKKGWRNMWKVSAPKNDKILNWPQNIGPAPHKI